jgi:hypothetical protein
VRKGLSDAANSPPLGVSGDKHEALDFAAMMARPGIVRDFVSATRVASR